MSALSLTTLRFRVSRYRRLAWWGSGLACLLSLIGLLACWLNPSIGSPLKPGLDFTGGTQIQFERACSATCPSVSADQIQQKLSQLQLPPAPQQSTPSLSGAVIQVLDQGRSLVVRLPPLNPEQAALVTDAVAEVVGPLNPDGLSLDTIGPTLGSQLLQGSLLSLLASFAAIALYITFRYDRLFA
jgi:preprotein translocase subunit SecF